MLQVASYVVSGMEEVAAKFNVTGKVNVQFVVDGSGVLSLAKAEAIVELPDLPPPNKTKSGAKANATDEADAKKEGEAKEEGEVCVVLCWYRDGCVCVCMRQCALLSCA